MEYYETIYSRSSNNYPDYMYIMYTCIYYNTKKTPICVRWLSNHTFQTNTYKNVANKICFTCWHNLLAA